MQTVNLRPSASIDDVVRNMTTIDGALPDDDGVKWFNRLYLRVTIAVRSAAAGATFRDRAFLELLDVLFANLYFEAAVAGLKEAEAAPPAWRPLFRARQQRGLAPLQFALAGMNAHINRDLPNGIVECFVRSGGAPDDEGPRYEDFQRVNGLLESVEEEVKTEFLTGPLATLDVAAGQLDDTLAMWNVRAAREAAWTNAQVLWALRDTPRLRDRFFDRLDRLTGFAGRGLLVPCAIR
ncbi:MAG: DUF5995 family protein [Acidobacteriota bacterium]